MAFMPRYKLGERAEAEFIKRQLKLRRNEVKCCFEVYTTIHGSGVFRWFQITYEVYNWYRSNFPDVPFVEPLKVAKDGGLEDPTVLKLFLNLEKQNAKRNKDTR